MDDKQRLASQQERAQELQSPAQDEAIRGEDGSEALIADGFLVPNLDVSDETEPPAYGEQPGQVQFSQPGFDAGAEVTGTCRPFMIQTRTILSVMFQYNVLLIYPNPPRRRQSQHQPAYERPTACTPPCANNRQANLRGAPASAAAGIHSSWPWCRTWPTAPA